MVSYRDFFDYYKVVSSTIDNDAFFELVMNRLWSPPCTGGIGDGGSALGSPRSAAATREGDRVSPVASNAGGAPLSMAGSPPRRGIGFDREPKLASPSARGSLTKSSIRFEEPYSTGLDDVFDRLRDGIALRGMRGWVSVVQRFEQYDFRRNGTVMRLDWERLNKSLGLGLAPDEREALFKALSANRRDGGMDYQMCLNILRGPPSKWRQELIQRLFDQLVDASGIVPLSSLRRGFDPRNAPACLCGRKDAQQVGQEFKDAVEFFGSGEAGFTPERFGEFFSMVSGVYHEDDEFRLMTTAAFGSPSVLSLGGS